ncbi:MAG: Pyridoxamine 5-phosphate oxidase-related protein [Firmicutes bacterium]|nr:Pyridoxamine 5-phosphate oxidase-related protein [Bacillota bacterium]
MKNMRRSERQMEDKQALELLMQGEYGILATADRNYQPYGIPLNYIVIDNCIYFHCAIDGHKLQNIAENSKGCFTVVVSTHLIPEKFSTEYESVIAFGKVSIVEDDKEKIMALREFVKKYSGAFTLEGDQYIEKAKHLTVAVKMMIQSFKGKHRV